MKIKTVYKCNECAYESPKWVGQCPSCSTWNGFSEETIDQIGKKLQERSHRNVEPKKLSPLAVNKEINFTRLLTGIGEVDRTLGGGFVPASATLLGGEPGIGKSTLTLQLTKQIADQKQKVIYISGEESLNQVAQRAERLNINTEDVFFLQENNLESLIATIEHEKPNFLIIDSIQTISSLDSSGMPGSISQTITVTERLIEHCKSKNVTLLLIGHVTKEGSLAGPKMLEHLVDTVLLLEVDRQHQNRVLRTSKNRFGSTSEIGLFQMEGVGLIEVKDPSLQFFEGREAKSIGSIFSMTIEGLRPLLVEIQALTNPTPFGYPKRTAHGFDLTRVHILSAVLQKYSRIKLNEQDIFINIAGGFKVSDPATDLALALAIHSSYFKKEIPSNMAVLGEIGLSGEVRSVSNIELRLKELQKLGIKKVIVPPLKNLKNTFELELIEIKNIKEYSGK